MPSGSTPTCTSPMRHALLNIDDRDRIVVLVSDIKNFAGRILGEQLGIRTGRQCADDLMCAGVDHLNRVVVSDRYQNELSILCELDPTGPLANLDRPHDRKLVDIDDADCVALLVGDVGGEGARWSWDDQASAKQARAPGI